MSSTCRYDSSKTFSENVELTDPILSRFDVLCVVKVRIKVSDLTTIKDVVYFFCSYKSVIFLMFRTLLILYVMRCLLSSLSIATSDLSLKAQKR